VALEERALGGHASERAMYSITQTRPQRNSPVRGDWAKLFGEGLLEVGAQRLGHPRHLTDESATACRPFECVGVVALNPRKTSAHEAAA
jgi:hypothetical protein